MTGSAAKPERATPLTLVKLPNTHTRAASAARPPGTAPAAQKRLGLTVTGADSAIKIANLRMVRTLS